MPTAICAAALLSGSASESCDAVTGTAGSCAACCCDWMYLLHGKATCEHSQMPLVLCFNEVRVTSAVKVPQFTHPMNLFSAETYARALATTTSSEDAVPENVR